MQKLQRYLQRIYISKINCHNKQICQLLIYAILRECSITIQPIYQIMQAKEDTINFCFAYNDKSAKSCKMLIDFKSVISKALPNMDKPHIIRLLFDSRHESMIAYNNEGMIGGVSYAIHENAKFVQLAFLAVKAEKRVQGYGKKIMNKFKAHIQQKKLNYIITYGDNMALGFFRKQGFSQKITMPREQWEGYIKEYDGGKLMECKIHPTVDYININSIIKKQKLYVVQMIKRCSLNETKFQTKKIQELNKQSKQLERKLNDETVQKFKRDPRKIPGVVQSGWDWEEYDLIKNSDLETFAARCKRLIEQIKRYPQAKYFIEPVSKSQVPNYHVIITQPMDLMTISQKLASQQYNNQQELCDDIELIFTNCMKFNHPLSVYYKSAVKLKQLISVQLQAFRHSMISTLKTQASM